MTIGEALDKRIGKHHKRLAAGAARANGYADKVAGPDGQPTENPQTPEDFMAARFFNMLVDWAGNVEADRAAQDARQATMQKFREDLGVG